jgi:mono/diheme cytochrome c family protein
MRGASAAILVVMLGCGGGGQGTPSPSPSAAPSWKAAEASWSSLDQGWSDADRESFWFSPQGSMLIPYAWFLHLEQPDAMAPFREDTHMARLGYLVAGVSDRNPDGLPIGFVRDRRQQDGEDMLGLTCAACHVSRLELEGKVVQIEGGPTLGDFEALLSGLVGSLRATLADGSKFQRFATGVAGQGTGDKAEDLRRRVDAFTQRLARREKLNQPPAPYGRGRVDALGNILNEVLVEDQGIPENARPSDAPVSYPVMWDAHQHDFVQWNGSAPNSGPGPLLRNIGEVLGVFGRMEFTPRKGHFAVYKNSTVDVAGLKALEVLVARLESPQWPAAFPAVDQAAAAAGKALYATHCENCHALIVRDDPERRIKAKLMTVAAIGTDPVAATNFVERQAKTGALRGTPVFVDLRQTFGETASAGDIIRNAVFGVSLGQFELGLPHFQRPKLPSGGLRGLLDEQWRGLEQKVKDQHTALKTIVAGNPPQLTTAMYKTRPLNGVWASAPYLHNGSVPTLWELLKKPEERAKRFFVGSRQFDPKDVGLRSVAEEAGVRFFDFDVSVRGNSNAGHPYGTALKDDEKRQLVEYLKTL